MHRIIALARVALPLAVMAQGRHYGDIDYAVPDDCRIVTEANPGNPFAPLLRAHCEQSNARLKQTFARIQGRP